MPLNLKRVLRQGLAAVFALADFVEPATFYRPVGFNKVTGQVASAELAAACQFLAGGYRALDLGLAALEPGDERVMVLAAELAGIARPGAGDYFVAEATGQRWDIVGGRLDRWGEYWVFHARRSASEDRGGLAAATVSEDWGDLESATDFEDCLIIN